jgi:biopolymer transport protein ExbD
MATFGNHAKGSVNVELNIIPFIDLMSCLTAFLLVTAVWVNVANLHNTPAGRSRDQIEPPEHPKIAILLDRDSIQISATPSGQGAEVPAGDWEKLAATLKTFQLADETPRVEIAALSTDAHPISYQSLVITMDTAMKAGYPDVGVTDPSSLTR